MVTDLIAHLKESLMRLLRSARAGIAVVCASALVVGTAAGAHHGDGRPARAEAAIATITIKVAKKAITVRGARGLHAGRVKVKVTGKGVAEILDVRPRLRLRRLQQGRAAADKGDVKALKRAIAHTEFLGGVQPGSSGTVVLPKAGEYTVFSFASRGHAVVQGRHGQAGSSSAEGGRQDRRQDRSEVGRVDQPPRQGHVHVQERRPRRCRTS